uniref:NS protein n=1 Tax=Avian orthoreovirus TaxID=38170 RepID=A0A1J0M4W0_9REOV|nr:NS protein [Avian orthoreovirus]APD15406.1 NS protein [Avian orthoreovirus]
MQWLRHTTFEVRRFDFCPISLRELATPSFTAITGIGPSQYFNIELQHTHPLYSKLPTLLSQPCRVHVRLIRRFALCSTLSNICEYDCALLLSPHAIVPLSSSDQRSYLIVHWDGGSQSITAKRGRQLDTVIDFERDYKSWRFDVNP